MLNALSRLGALYSDLTAALEQAGAGDSLYARALANGVAGTADSSAVLSCRGLIVQSCSVGRAAWGLASSQLATLGTPPKEAPPRCRAAPAELLDVYRLAVLQVEQHLLHYPAPPLLTLQQFLGEFQVSSLAWRWLGNRQAAKPGHMGLQNFFAS